MAIHADCDTVMNVVVDTQGISNRIRTLLLSLCLDKNVKIYWPVNNLTGCEFDKLFTNDIEIKRMRGAVYDTRQLEKIAGELYQKYNMTRLCIGSSVYRLIKDSIKILNFHPAITNGTDNVLQSIDCNNTIGVQIRTWREAPFLYKNRFSVSKYFGKIDEILEGNMLYVSCDCESILSKIKARYGMRVLVNESCKKHGDRSTVNGLRDILIDFIVTSKCNKIIGDSWSTYTINSWWFGDRPEMFYV